MGKVYVNVIEADHRCGFLEMNNQSSIGRIVDKWSELKDAKDVQPDDEYLSDVEVLRQLQNTPPGFSRMAVVIYYPNDLRMRQTVLMSKGRYQESVVFEVEPG